MAGERLFLDERNLKQLGLTEPNIRTMRELTKFLNIQNTVTNVVGPLEDLTTTGLLARTGLNEWATRTLTGPLAGITVTNGDGVAGNPTLALANDLAALEGLASTGLIARTADGAAAARTLTAGANISITNGNGVSGNPTVAVTGLAAAVGAALVAGSNVTITDNGNGTFTVAASGGGGAASAIGTPIFSGTANPAVNNYVMVMLVADSAFTINKVAFEMTAAVATTKFQAFVYASNAAGTPGSLLASSSQVTGATAGYNEIALTSGATLAKGDLFWIGVNVTTASLNGLRCRPGGLAAFAANGSSTVPAATAPAITTFTTANAIYGFWGVA